MIKPAIRTKKNLFQTNLRHLLQLFFLLLITFRNIKCKRPDSDAMYRYVLKIAATNADRDFVETIVGKLVNKNKPAAQGLDSYFVVIAKKTWK